MQIGGFHAALKPRTNPALAGLWFDLENSYQTHLGYPTPTATTQEATRALIVAGVSRDEIRARVESLMDPKN